MRILTTSFPAFQNKQYHPAGKSFPTCFLVSFCSFFLLWGSGGGGGGSIKLRGRGGRDLYTIPFYKINTNIRVLQ